MSVNNNKEKESIIALKNNNFPAFDYLYNLYKERLYGFAVGYLKSTEEAKGLVQNVFLKVWENRAELDEAKSFNAYLFTIAKNTILNHFRKKANEQSYIDHLKTNFDLFYNRTAEDIEYSDLEEQVKKIVDLLPKRRREIYLMSRTEGFNNDEIAVKLNISRKTVENQITLATKVLREKLETANIIIILFIYLFL